MTEYSRQHSIFLFTSLMGKLKICVKGTRMMMYTILSCYRRQNPQ